MKGIAYISSFTLICLQVLPEWTHPLMAQKLLITFTVGLEESTHVLLPKIVGTFSYIVQTCLLLRESFNCLKSPDDKNKL